MSNSPIEQLTHSAQAFFHRSIEAHTDRSHVEVAALAPLGLEHLLKALLWTRNPVLVIQMNQGNEASLQHLAGPHPTLTYPQLKTAGLKEALQRSRIPAEPTEVDYLQRARNGAVHVGSPADTTAVLAICLDIATTTLHELTREPDDFFAPHQTIVDKLLNARKNGIAQAVSKKITQAKETFQTLRESPDSLAAQHRQRAAAQYVPLEPWRGALDDQCPACHSTGYLEGPLDTEPTTDPKAPDEYPHRYWLGLVITPEHFTCLVCELQLDLNEIRYLDLGRTTTSSIRTREPVWNDDGNWEPALQQTAPLTLKQPTEGSPLLGIASWHWQDDPDNDTPTTT